MQQQTSIIQRRVDLDWLRIIAILTVFVFHSIRFFDRFPWHVKNPTTYDSVQFVTMFVSSWGMPLIFMISGASLFFSVGKVGKFIKDKVLRLLVPLVVGVFTHVSIAVYLERLTYGKFRGSFFEFYPQYFNGPYDSGGNFAWMGLHLWYLLVLFVYSLALLPLFYLLKGPWNRALRWLGDFFALPGMIYALALPIMLILVFVNPTSVFGERTWGGWSLAGYIPFFLSGFLLISHEGLQARAKAYRWLTLALAIVCTAFLLQVYGRVGGNPPFRSANYALLNGLYALNAWLWVLSIVSLGMQYMTMQNKFLYYAGEAVLPFYILHQTILLVVGYYVTRWAIPDPLKFLIIAPVSFLICILLYEYTIRRVNVMRFLFGMKVKPQAAQAPASTAAPLKA